jgi:hypothetical protein
MSYVIAATVGLVIWIVLWALDISGFDAILIAVGLVLAVSVARAMTPRLTSRKD